ncbi:GntR family transcriptional regulator [uncultured Roseobacter sp.]|uniref:GntR family transcriptional regulator n=1 Tax=uncultured Roseobacter sp. TaxID=114847 RepID=UPI002620FB85|nr:GntR family transcriptional regulator [uncultured Roseobacter sp.]
MAPAPENPGPLPKYVQLAELLIRDIDTGRLMDGERLPPERQMATDLHTSVGTLRKALRVMEHKGLLRRVQGSGNYIQRKGGPGGTYAMFRLELLSGGGLPSAKVIDLAPLEKPDDLPVFGTASRATRIRRERFLNDTAIAVEEIWLDAGMGELSRAMLSDSLYQTYLQRLGFWVTRAEDRVSIGTLPDWTPVHFGTPGTPCGYIERYSWADRPQAIEFSRTWFDPTRASYVQRLR